MKKRSYVLLLQAGAETEVVIGLPDAAVPVKGLGSSDCRCPSHLIRFADVSFSIGRNEKDVSFSIGRNEKDVPSFTEVAAALGHYGVFRRQDIRGVV